MTREALKKLNEKQMNYCKTLSALIDRAKIKRACNAGSYRAGSMGDRGRHNNSGYYRTAGAYVSFQ